MTHTFTSEGSTFMLVPVPDDAKHFYLPPLDYHIGYCCNYSNDIHEHVVVKLEVNIKKKQQILGCFSPSKNEIDFEPNCFVRDEWIGKLEKRNPFTLEQAFKELLQSEAAKKWPMKVNSLPKCSCKLGTKKFEECPNINSSVTNCSVHQKWEEAQTQVLPSKILVIRIEK